MERFFDLARERKDKNPAFVQLQERLQQIALAREKHAIQNAQIAVLPDTEGAFTMQPLLQITGENGELLQLIAKFIASKPSDERIDSLSLNEFFEQEKAEINRILKLSKKTEIKIIADAADIKERALKPKPQPNPLLALDDREQVEVWQKANGRYEYRDEEMHLVNKARNHAKGYGYVALPNIAEGFPDRIRASGILMRRRDDNIEEAGALNAERFVRNSRGGIVVECPAMSLMGAEAGRAAAYLEHTVSDILTLERLHPSFGVYPAKIIFPFNPSQGHWIAGEIILKKNARGEFSAEIAQYNPMSNYSSPVSEHFCAEFARVFHEAAHKSGIDAHVAIERPAAVKIGRRDGSGEVVTMQCGGVACGVYAAYFLDHLKEGDATTMCDGFPYDGSDAMTQRIADAQSVRKLAIEGVITAESYANFGYQPARGAFVTNSAAMKKYAESLAHDFAISAGTASPKPAKPKADIKAAVAKVTKTTKAEKTAAKKIEALDQFIAANYDDKELLSAVLLSLTSENDDEAVNFAMASNLIAAGAQITEAMLEPRTPSIGARVKKALSKDSLKDAMQDKLRNEYFLQALRKEKLDEIERLLQQYDIDLQYCSVKEGSSALHYAAQNADPAVASLVASHGPNINAQDNVGHSPLMIAVMCGNVEVVRYLITQGADINLCDSRNIAALDLAKSFAEIMPSEVVKYTEIVHLIEAKAAHKDHGKAEPKPLDPKEKSTLDLLQGIIDFCDSAAISEEDLAKKIKRISDIHGATKAKAVETKTKYLKALAASTKFPPQTLLLTRFLAAQMHNVLHNISEGVEVDPAFHGHIVEMNKLINTLQLDVEADEKRAGGGMDEGTKIILAVESLAKTQSYPLDKDVVVVPKAPLGATKPKPIDSPKKAADLAKMPSDVIAASGVYDKALAILQDKPIVRKQLTLDRSDFFLREEIKYAKENGEQLPHILITADDLSFQACPDDGGFKTDNRDDEENLLENSEESTYVTLDGKYKDLFQPLTKNPSNAFQPHFANFGAMYFKEEVDGKKIFNNANLFMANSRNCVFDGVDFAGIPTDAFLTMNFNKCSFVNVDFSQITVKALIYMKVLDDKFENCTFQNCKFPAGISVKGNHEFVVSDDIAAEVEQVRNALAPIKAELDVNEKELFEAKRHDYKLEQDAKITGVKVSKSDKLIEIRVALLRDILENKRELAEATESYFAATKPTRDHLLVGLHRH